VVVGKFDLTSTLAARYRHDLEELMFFNPLQQNAHGAVLDAIDRFGIPEIGDVRGELRIMVGHQDVQALFALAEADGKLELAGVVLYLRTDPANVTVLHVAVKQRFSAVGADADAMLALRLINAVCDSVRRLKGTERVTILYPHCVRNMHRQRARAS
jgi:hypothetical protein